MAAKNNIFLQDPDAACFLYGEAWNQGLGPDSAQLQNNVGICALRQWYAQPDLKDQFLEVAETSLKRAKEVAKTEQHQETTGKNLAKFYVWKESGGTYPGNMMW